MTWIFFCRGSLPPRPPGPLPYLLNPLKISDEVPSSFLGLIIKRLRKERRSCFYYLDCLAVQRWFRLLGFSGRDRMISPCSTRGMTWVLMAQGTDVIPRKSAISCRLRGTAQKRSSLSSAVPASRGAAGSAASCMDA